MASHAQGINTTSNGYRKFPDSRHNYATATSSARPSHHRVRTYTAHALVLFNVYGIVLSSGLWLEYYFTSLFPATSLLAVSAIFGTQLACLGLGVGVAASLHRRWPKHWRLLMSLGGLSVGCSHICVLIADEFWVVLLCEGALTGLGLGVLSTVSTRVLSTHYKNDIAVASSQCVAAGFLGAVVYTIFTWLCLRSDNTKLGRGLIPTLLCLTLLPAVLLAKPSALQPVTHHSSPPARFATPRLSSMLFVILYTPPFLATSLLLPLILTRHPSPYRADPGCYVLLALSSAALLSSALLPHLPSHRLSPPALIAASTLLAGIAIPSLIWMPTLYVGVPCAMVLGAGLGGVCALWVRALAALVGKGKRLGQAVCLLAAVGGVGAGCGVLGAAAVMETWEAGVEIVLGVAAGCLVLGGLALGAGAGVRRWG
ncbi:major facilitator superfamily domain-containing protein [Boeremia exigua]|uniref:major facilitator superfamily domain-containing protein n=1 Tax=Boeremia exigua TaxID=749465 RepID=UPI001E8DABC0|nr:major facilitator superfamily domain-containing protein [Boeremia exigua]KAH6633050.1 major facilitator superfamily domain-containing protein [Boeremia exigua]